MADTSTLRAEAANRWLRHGPLSMANVVGDERGLTATAVAELQRMMAGWLDAEDDGGHVGGCGQW